ncbi:hypothetical protein SAMN04488128_10937 [Chitinophaga eiseniae]|uniref:Uncharacterized protein n=1 Tax=Chitinophaga eiseniae TaxID=634771 RepID=A0A1T4U4R7_9BACT|nr:hypothetical protein SAMN04488128_10937 [Chitinophaga eiseniae]
MQASRFQLVFVHSRLLFGSICLKSGKQATIVA